ncbi:hypothetical protein [Bifidobacterium simiiventris]|uniref:hypothetical protein n=1 Tax=Bifidobacterium simiiventris TaxID=2834434 RepID=UPI001C55C40F|nr:hypothetical protein [Bifidobacterium simiiventris]MBW3077714.1 hypothetical protein [Bifidobacterium simiiventris]
MSTRIYCDQCGSETGKFKALHFHLSGYSANSNNMSPIGEIEIDVCPKCAETFDERDIGIVHVHRDHRSKLAPYSLEYQPLTTKDQTL